jgi:hypothetical protein
MILVNRFITRQEASRMRDCNHGKVSFLRRQFLQEGELPFTDVLSEEAVAPALEAIEACWNDRIYTPLVTLWVFLGQVISADHSCRAAVARLTRGNHLRRRKNLGTDRRLICFNESGTDWVSS